METYFITGVAGFLGSRLAAKLIENGVRVVGITRNIDNPSLAELKKSGLFSCLTGNIEPSVLSGLDGYTIKGVYHLAAQIPDRRVSYDEYYFSNVTVTRHLIDYFEKKQPDFFLYTSTSSVFGQPIDLVTPDACPSPMDHYGLTKYIAEKLLQFAFGNLHTKKIIVRLQSVFGQGEKYGLLHTLYTQFSSQSEVELLGRGERLRNLISAEDAVSILVAFVAKYRDLSSFEIFQAASRNSLSTAAIAEIIKNELRSESMIVLSDKRGGYDWDIVVDASKTYKTLGVQAASMEDGIRNYLNQAKNAI